MSEQWNETCQCGASIKLTGWVYSNTEKAALEWRKDHRCKPLHTYRRRRMTEELEARILEIEEGGDTARLSRALEAVMELHTRHTAFDGNLDFCPLCVKSEGATYPCDTVQAIHEELED